MADETIRIKFISDIANAIGGINQIQSRLKGLEGTYRDSEGKLRDAQGRFSAGWKQIGNDIAGVGRTMTAAVTLPIVGGLALATKQAIDFDKAMTGVSRAANLEGDMQTGEFAAMSKEIRTLAPTLGVLPTEFAQLATEAAKLGVTKDRIMGFTKTVGELGQIGDVAGSQLVDMTQDLAAIQTVTGATDSELKRLGATANLLDDQVGGTIQGIIKGVNLMSARANPLGIDVNTLAAYSSTFQALNLQVGQSANAFDKLITKLAAPATLSDRAKDGLEKLGLTSRDVSVAMKQDAEGGLRMFLGRLNELSKTDTQSALEAVSMFIGEEYGSEIFALAQGIDKLDQALGYAGDSTQAFNKYQTELAKKQQSVSGQLAIARAQFQSIGISLGLAILPAVTKLLSFVLPLASGFANFAANHPRIVFLGVAIAGVVAAIAPLVWITGSLIASWGTITTVWTAVTGVLGAGLIPKIVSFTYSLAMGAIPAIQGFVAAASTMALPVTLAAAAIGLIAWNIWNYARQWDDVWLGMKYTAEGVVNWLQGLWNAGWDAGAGLIRGFVEGMRSHFAWAQSAIGNFTTSIRAYLPFSPAKTGALSDLDKSGGALVNTLVRGIQSAAPSLNSALDSALGSGIATPVATVATGGGGGSSVVVNFTVNLGGSDGNRESSTALLDKFRPIAAQIGEEIERALGRKRRGTY